MRVAVVYPIPFGEDGGFGGGERYAYELARALARRVDTRLVTVGQRRSSRVVDGLRIETHPFLRLVEGSLSNPLTIGFLRSLQGVDVIHCTSYSTLLTDLAVVYARATGKRVFITDIGGGGSVTLARVVNVARLSHGLLLLSQFANRLFPGTRPSRHVVYGGVDVDRFSPASAPRDRSVLYVGRLLPHKGVDYLIEAMPPGLPLRIVGRPYSTAYAERLARAARDKDVSFIADADDARLVEEYRRAAMCVLPSVYRTSDGGVADAPELLGLTLLEAMACATPVVCTDVGSLPEVVEDGRTGYVVPPNDPAALTARISTLIENPANATVMGSAARDHVLARFTWSVVAESCLRAYVDGTAEQTQERAA